MKGTHILGLLVLALAWDAARTQLISGPGVSNCNYELDVVFAIDGSNSMLENNFHLQKAALVNLINSLHVTPLDIRVGIVMFSTEISSFPLSGDKYAITRYVNSLQYPGESTRTDLAIGVTTNMLMAGRGGNVKKLLVIITDGRSTLTGVTYSAANAAKAQGITIFAVGVGDAIKEIELMQLASSRQSVFHSNDFQALRNVLTLATNEACITISTTPASRALVCNSQLDLVVAIDGSNSLYEAHFNLQKQAIIAMIDELDVEPKNIHAGTVLFSGDVQSTPLTGNKAYVINAINALQYPDDATRTDLAIQRATQLLQAGRPNVNKVLIIVTDGRSTYPARSVFEATRAKRAGISIFTVGVTDAIYRPELHALASAPDQVFLTANFQTLGTDLLEDVKQVCTSL